MIKNSNENSHKMLSAIFIDAENRKVIGIGLNSADDIKKILKCSAWEKAAILGTERDNILYIDQDRQNNITPGQAGFAYNDLPVQGNGLIAGINKNDSSLKNVTIKAEDVEKFIVFIKHSL